MPKHRSTVTPAVPAGLPRSSHRPGDSPAAGRSRRSPKAEVTGAGGRLRPRRRPVRARSARARRNPAPPDTSVDATSPTADGEGWGDGAEPTVRSLLRDLAPDASPRTRRWRGGPTRRRGAPNPQCPRTAGVRRAGRQAPESSCGEPTVRSIRLRNPPDSGRIPGPSRPRCGRPPSFTVEIHHRVDHRFRAIRTGARAVKADRPSRESSSIVRIRTSRNAPPVRRAHRRA